MIKINLLPVEKRKAERTPMRGLLLIIVDAAAVLLVLFVCGLISFKIGAENSSISSTKFEIERLKKDVDLHAQLSKNIQTRNAQKTELANLTQRKVEWWRAVDVLWEVINQNRNVWVVDISAMDGSQAQSAAKTYDPDSPAQPPFGLSVRCFCSGNDVSAFTKFRMDLKQNGELRKIFSEINWDVSVNYNEESGTVEQYSIPFDIKLIGRQAVAGGKK